MQKEKEGGPKKKEVVNRRAEYQSEIDVHDILVIDNGTDTCKIGISGEDLPRLVINSLVGIPEIKNESDLVSSKGRRLFGPALLQAFQEKKHTIHLEQPIANSSIQNLEDMEEMWRYIIQEVMQLDPTNLSVMYVDSPLNSKDYKAKIAHAFFEGLKVNSLVFMNSSTLSLFSTGHTTGFVTEIGHGSTTAIPVFEGFVLPHAAQSSYISGAEVTRKWQEQLKELKIPLNCENELAELEVVRRIKEKMSLAAKDYAELVSKPDRQNIEERSYQLPDGTVIQFPIGSRATPPEILFQPKLAGSSAMSLVEMILYSLQLCDSQLQQEMANNFLICGGSSLIRGIQAKIERELRLSQPRTNFNFVMSTQRRYSAWIGGSMLGSLSAFQKLAILKKDYEENSSEKLVHKRTF